MITKLKFMGTYAKVKLGRLLSDEKGDVNVVAIVVLIGIAVLLAIIFKDSITKLLETLFGTIDKSAKDAITPKTP